MKKVLLSSLVLAALAAGCKKEDATPTSMQVTGTMSGSNEVPTVATSATGSLSGSYAPDTKVLTYTVTYAGLTPTSGHIHSGAPGTNGPVEVMFANVATSPFTGTVTLTQNQADALLAGKMYTNLHTSANAGGELRANLVAK